MTWIAARDSRYSSPMRLTSPYSILLGVALVGCVNGEGSSLDTYNTSMSTGTGTDSAESPEESTDTDESGTEETGEPEPYEGLRYLVTGTEDALMLGINLDDPLAVPEPQVLVSGVGTTTMFGPTPHGGEIVVHDGHIDQLRLRSTADYDFTPLAPQDAAWLDRAWFGVDGANAIMTIGLEVLGATQQLLWVVYDDDGEVLSSTDITPPIEANGAVLVPDFGTDSRNVAVLVDVELDSIWQIYALNLDPEPNVATYIDQLDLGGLPPNSVGNFIWLDVHPNRISYRKELLPGIFRPVAVALDDPEVTRVNLAPSLGHISSMMWSPDQTRLLVSAGGETGYRELWLIDVFEGNLPQTPIKITEFGHDARVNTQSTVDFATLGHGFDNQGRIWYAYTDSMLVEPASVGVNLVVVFEGDIIQRVDLIEPYPGLEIDEVVFDEKLQLLGFRAQSSSFGGSVYYVDLNEAQYSIVQLDQAFAHDELIPFDDVNYAFSPDGRRIVAVGVQDGMTSLHVAEIGDTLGTTTEITLPGVETAPGIVIDHKPRVSPDGEQVILWYSVQDGRDGLIHAPLDGSAEGQVVLGLQQSLGAGTYLQHLPE
jgi:hypothetical protein